MLIKIFSNKLLIFVALYLLLVGSTYYYYKLYLLSQEELKISVTNNKSYSNELSNIKDKNRLFQFTIELMKYFNDSINEKLMKVSKDLKIKESKIRSLLYLLSSSSKIDTVEFHHVDTIFKDESINIDTIIGDEWYKLKLGLRFPNKIITEPSFKSEKSIISYDRKETLAPPHKFFLFRWFQKKHNIRIIEVYEASPYVNDSIQRFIEIIK